MSNNHKALSVDLAHREKHPNADKLEIIRIWGTVPYIANIAEWKDKTVGIFIQPDNLVDTSREEFKGFIKPGKTPGWTKVKTEKIRGYPSMGILIPCPEGTPLDQDFTEQLGVKPYEPDVHETTTRGFCVKAPSGDYPKYDVENYYKYINYFETGEPIVITEKLHGSNCKFLVKDEVLYVGGRTMWHQEDKKLLFWKAFRENPLWEELAKQFNGYCFYGEAVGEQKNFKYGLDQGVMQFKLFDILQPDNTWMGWGMLKTIFNNIPGLTVPVLYEGPFDIETCLTMMSGPSLVAGASHQREGCCIRPQKEQWIEHLGRKHLKFVDPSFINRK